MASKFVCLPSLLKSCSIRISLAPRPHNYVMILYLVCSFHQRGGNKASSPSIKDASGSFSAPIREWSGLCLHVYMQVFHALLNFMLTLELPCPFSWIKFSMFIENSLHKIFAMYIQDSSGNWLAKTPNKGGKVAV